MKREIIFTADGSTTIHLPQWNEQYHSKHGAIQEAYHVFIKHGLHHFYNQVFQTTNTQKDKNPIAILEIGFGTGLNAYITLLETKKLNLAVSYCGVEGFPILKDEMHQLNFSKVLKTTQDDSIFDKLHQVSWNEKHHITSCFSLIKQQKMFHQINDKNAYNIIYFDAFGARVQPELWTEVIFKKMFEALKPRGVLVTYSAKGSVKRAMQAVGFTVEKLPGPPGKREMLRATK